MPSIILLLSSLYTISAARAERLLSEATALGIDPRRPLSTLDIEDAAIRVQSLRAIVRAGDAEALPDYIHWTTELETLCRIHSKNLARLRETDATAFHSVFDRNSTRWSDVWSAAMN